MYIKSKDEVLQIQLLGAAYMGSRTGHLPGWDVKQDLTMHVQYISLI